MKKFSSNLIFLLVIVSILLSSCNMSQKSSLTNVASAIASEIPTTPLTISATAILPLPTSTIAPPTQTSAPTLTNTPTPSFTPTQPVYGPDMFPSGTNPLTGLPVADPTNLSLLPVLVSISTFPESGRPEAGLSFASWVFEAFIGEGMTRYLAVYYGDLPTATSSAGSSTSEPSIGPVRSGRTWYEDARKLFNGFIVMASASANVAANLSAYTSVFGSNEGDINSAMIPVSNLKAIAQKNSTQLVDGALTGNEFNAVAPEGGKAAQSLWIRWSFLNQIFWKFDPTSDSYNRYQNGTTEDFSQVFTKSTDRLNGDPLTFENVVVLFVNYRIKKFTNIRIDLLDVTRPALLFRDGKMYEIKWTSVNDNFAKKYGVRRPIRFLDDQGNPFPLKPGQTWLEVIPMYTPYYETVDSEDILKMLKSETPGSGHWALVFYTPPNTP